MVNASVQNQQPRFIAFIHFIGKGESAPYGTCQLKGFPMFIAFCHRIIHILQPVYSAVFYCWLLSFIPQLSQSN